MSPWFHCLNTKVLFRVHLSGVSCLFSESGFCLFVHFQISYCITCLCEKFLRVYFFFGQRGVISFLEIIRYFCYRYVRTSLFSFSHFCFSLPTYFKIPLFSRPRIFGGKSLGLSCVNCVLSMYLNDKIILRYWTVLTSCYIVNLSIESNTIFFPFLEDSRIWYS